MEDLIGRYGYALIFFGTLFEGETVYLIAAYLAHAEYFKIEYVALTGFAGTFIGDQAYFLIGRRWGRALLAKKPSWRPRLARVFDLLERHETLFILSFRFIYGLRNISPFAIGMSDIKASKFVLLNFLAALVWAAVFGAIGFLAGGAIHSVIGKVESAEIYVVGAIAIMGIVIWLCILYRGLRKRRSS